MFLLLQVVSHDLSHIHHTPAEDHPTKVAIMWFSHLVVVNTPQKKSGITHPKNEQNGLGWDNGFGPTPNLQFSSQLWGILKANSHQTSSNPQIPKRNPGLVLDLQYLFFWERGTVRVRFFHWCCIKISYIYIYIPAMLLQDLIYMIYIYICIPQKFHPAGSQETKHIAHAQRETK